MSFSFGSFLALLCAFTTVSVSSGAHAATGSVKGVVLSAATEEPVAQGSVALTLNGVPWGATAPIDGSGNFDFGTVTWAGTSVASAQVQTSGTGFIDSGVSGTLAPSGTFNVLLHLQPGSSISGTVADSAANPPISTGSVLIYDSGGVLLGSAPANAQGAYHYGGLVAGSYYARTDFPDYLDELWSGIACANGDCIVTSGTPIQLPDQSTDSVADFQLVLDLIFSDGFGG